MPFHRHLPDTAIDAIRDVATNLGLADSRDTLLSGLPPSFIASLPKAFTPAEQLHRDLHTMNAIEAMEDAETTVPLQRWLSAAHQLHKLRTEAKIFEEALGKLTSRAVPPRFTTTTATPFTPAAPNPAHPSHQPTIPVDFLLITALEEELSALLAKLPNIRKLDRDGRDTHTYYEAHLPTNRRDGATYRVLVTALSGMGPIKGAIKAGAVIQRWSPAHVLVVGIAGGVAGEVAPGDVLVASQVPDYTLGKQRGRGPREERWVVHPADANLLDAATNFPTGWEDLVTGARPAAGTPKRRIGVIASGGEVIASASRIAGYREDWPKLLGVEMEGGGVAAGLHDDIARPRFLMIRGVSDLADAEGDDNTATKAAWRAYACDVAAAYAVALLRDGPVPAAR